MNWKNFLRSGYTFSDSENELESRYKLINLILLFLSALLVFMVILYSYIDNKEGVSIYAASLLLSIFSLYIARKVGKNNYKNFAYGISLSFYVVTILGHLHEPNLYPFIAWGIIQIFISFIILDIKLSTLMSILYAFAIIEFGIYISDSTLKYILLQLIPLLFATVMIRVLNTKVFEALIQLDQTNKNLEKTVTQRTMEIQAEKSKLYTQANYDLLTDLPNRNNFYATIETWIDNDKGQNLKFALFFIDIDRFKRINDSFGHPVGDSVLKIVAQRLNSVADSQRFLYRISGDEFILLYKYDDEKDIDVLSNKIQKLIEPALILKEHTLYVSVSIGISLYPIDASNCDDLIRYSDISMFESKKEGMGVCTYYSHDMTQKVQRNVLLETQLYDALENHEFKVYYQPQVNVYTNEIVGLEALVRWISPESGMQAPGLFLPLAETTGFIIYIDYYVLKEGMRQIVAWKKNNLDVPRISFNISSMHLRERTFVTKLKEFLEETSCRGEWLELEITESHVMGNLDQAISILMELRGLGITVAIDDFGTGYTSLAYLEKLPIDKLKIDRFFIADIDEKHINRTIVKAIIDIAKSIGITTIAEGVETDKEKNYILNIGCHIIQGYLYYKPMSAEEIIGKALLAPMQHMKEGEYGKAS